MVILAGICPYYNAHPMKLLITGASGYIGGHLVTAFAADPGVSVVGVGGSKGDRRVDLADAAAVAALIADVRPDVIVNCAAISAPKACQEQGLDAINKINAPAHLADAAAGIGALLVQCSTDQVYEGTNAPYGPDPPSALRPVNVYGASKAQFDKVLAEHPACRSVTLRLSNVYGPPVNGLTKFLQWVAGRVDEATPAAPLSLFDDERRSFVFLDDVYRVVARVCERGAVLCPPGAAKNVIFNLGGPASLSRCDFGRALALHKGVDDGRVAGEPRPQMAVPTPLDITMDSAATFGALDVPQTAMAEALRSIFPGEGAQ